MPSRGHRASERTPSREAFVRSTFNGLSLDGPVAASDAPMFWDNRTRSLEQQALGPMTALAEMRGAAFDADHILPELAARLAAIPAYVTEFDAAFGAGAQVSIENATRAIAAFERSIVATDSSFDRYMQGDTTAMTAQQVRGMGVFQASGCTGCHAGPMFSDFQLHVLGVPDAPGAAHDPGDGQNRFRTASLRFVTRTAPYMHNGVFATLDDVDRFYRNADDRASDAALRRVRAPSGGDAADVTAFLGALSDGTFDTTVPTRVPSGLAVGGAIP